MAERRAVSFEVNGAPVTVEAWPFTRLLDVLRETCGLTGTKEGCGEGECGACSVLVNGELVTSCLVPVAQVAGARVETIEGLATQPDVGPILRALVACNGAQCGICTPGMVAACAVLLREDPDPDEARIREALAGNLCRCTGYVKIVEAVRLAARELRGAG